MIHWWMEGILPRVYDVIYTTALVVSMEGEINDNGFDINQPPFDNYEVNNINNLLRVSVISNNIPCLNPPYIPFYWTYNVSFIDNNIQSLPITIEINNNGTRVDNVIGGGNYSNLYNQNNFVYNDFVNILNVNNNQNIGNINVNNTKNIITLYLCESSRCFTNIIIFPIFYDLFNNNPNFRNVVSELLDILGDNISRSILTILEIFTPNNLNIQNIPILLNDQIEELNLNNLQYFPPVVLSGAVPAMRGIHNGIGQNSLFVGGNNDFFNNLNLDSGYDNSRSNNIDASKLYMLQTELFILNWNNQQEIINNVWQQILNQFNEDEMDSVQDCISAFLEGYTGINLNQDQTNQLITALINFFNIQFNLGLNNNEVQERVELVNGILIAPNNAENLIETFLAGENDMVIENIV